MPWISDPVYVLAVLAGNIVICEWLVANTRARHMGTALLVILLTAVEANLGLVPTASNSIPLYSGIFSYIAPIAIFILLLDVRLDTIRQAGSKMLLLFAVGALGTVLGTFAGLAVAGGAEFGENLAAVGGMFTGTYTGGSINFNALALHYKVNESGLLYTGAVVVDNIMTTLWMIATLALPRYLSRRWPRQQSAAAREQAASPDAGTLLSETRESVNVKDLSAIAGLAAAALWASETIAGLLPGLPMILVLTTLALVLAQVPAVRNLRGCTTVGMASVYLFLAVVGAFCELAPLGEIGALGTELTLFAGTLVLVHGLVIFGIGALLKQDWLMIAVASQANIGGGVSALAVAESSGRPDLNLAAILIGAVGNAAGTYLGFFVAAVLT